MKRLLGLLTGLLALVVAVQLAGWRRGSGAADSQTAPRIISMAPNLTSLLFRLGAGGHVVGVTSYCDDPEEASSLPRVGDFLNPNYERIVSLAPDLVLAERWSSSKSADRLRDLGLNVREVLSPHSVQEIMLLIAEVGEVVGRADEAGRLQQEMKRRIEAARRRGARYPFAPRVYLEIDRPTWTVGGPSFTSDALELCGARNLFEDLSRPASQVSAETVVYRNPDLILSFVASRQEIVARPGWDQIEAVRRGRIIEGFDEDLLSRANHRVVDGMEAFQAALEKAMHFAPAETDPSGDGN